jgi:hypothetical protein
MANLKKREIVIVSIAVLLILYAVYVYFIAGKLPGKKVQTVAATTKVESVTSGIAIELSKNKLSDLDNYTIKHAAIDWGKSPFLERNLYRAWQTKDGGGGTFKIIYSGYVDSGKHKMAVLNNVEYRIGEELKEEGYILKHITPLKVIIYDKRAGNNLEIFLQE